MRCKVLCWDDVSCGIGDRQIIAIDNKAVIVNIDILDSLDIQNCSIFVWLVSLLIHLDLAQIVLEFHLVFEL